MAEITEQGRKKFQEQIEDVHQLFKDFVSENRPTLDIDQVATGEYWHGVRAAELGLVNELMTSDDYLMTASETADIFEVKLATKASMAQKFSEMFASITDRVIDGVATRLS